MELSAEYHIDTLRKYIELKNGIPGVNIDEELADIIKFQYGYNASARFISVVDQMLDTIINRMDV